MIRARHTSAFGQSAEGVEDAAMGCWIEEAALLELPLDLNQKLADPAQQADAGWLVVDKGAGPPVTVQHPAEHQRPVDLESLFGQ